MKRLLIANRGEIALRVQRTDGAVEEMDLSGAAYSWRRVQGGKTQRQAMLQP